jgi:hypothetical protein
MKTCPKCEGYGKVWPPKGHGDSTVRCTTCNGTGQVNGAWDAASRARLHRALDAALDAQIEHNGYTCMRMPDSYTWTATAPGKKTIQASSLEQLKRFINNAKPIEYFGNAK